MIGASLGQALRTAAADLGMCSAAWLFVREVGSVGGDAMIVELRDGLGRDFPVLDAVCALYLDGQRRPRVEVAPVLAACAGARRVLVVGLESEFLDALVPALDAEIGLLTYGDLDADWNRVLANYGGRVRPCELASFQQYIGSRGALLTFLYGARGDTGHVVPAWLRVMGGDVRTQFRSLIGWDVLGVEPYVYPRWLVPTPLGDFSHVVS